MSVCVCVYLSRPITTKTSQAIFICRKLSVYYNNQNKTAENSGGEAEGWLSCLMFYSAGSPWDVLFESLFKSRDVDMSNVHGSHS